MKINYNVTSKDIPAERRAAKTKVQEAGDLLRKFIRSGKEVCGISYSGSVATAYQYLLKARKEGNLPVKIIKRGKCLFLQGGE